MQCMKCGREIPGGQVFCDACLDGMAKYPVKPGTAFYLPSRINTEPAKKQPQHRRPALQPEEQVIQLKKKLRRSRAALALAWLLLLGCVGAGVWYFYEENDGFLPGQNYSSVVTPDTVGADGE